MKSKKSDSKKLADRSRVLAEAIFGLILDGEPMKTVQIANMLAAESPQEKDAIFKHAMMIVAKDAVDWLLSEGRIFLDSSHCYRVAAKIKAAMNVADRSAIESLKSSVMRWVTSYESVEEGDCPNTDHLIALQVDPQRLNVALGELVAERRLVSSANADLALPT